MLTADVTMCYEQKWPSNTWASVSLMFLSHFDVFCDARQHGIYLFYIIKKQKRMLMTSSIRLSSSGSLVRTYQNARIIWLIISYYILSVFIACNTPTAVQSLWSVDICKLKFQPHNDQSGMVHLHRSEELFEYYNRVLFSCGEKIECPYILVRLLANSWVSLSKTAKPDKTVNIQVSNLHRGSSLPQIRL